MGCILSAGMPRKPTLKDVAKAAGVSVATVSRVLTDKNVVGPGAKTKVRQAAERMGYAPLRNRSSAQAPKDLKHGAVLLLWGTGREAMGSLGAQNLMRGLTQGLRNIGASLNVDYLDSTRDLPQLLKKRKVDGVFLHGQIDSPEAPETLNMLPVVWLYHQGSHAFGDRVEPDHAKVGDLACRHFFAQNCRRLCCITDTKHGDGGITRLRSNAFESVARSLGLPVELIECQLPLEAKGRGDKGRIHGTVAAEDASSIAMKFAELSPRPDALFVANYVGPFLHMELAKLNIIPMKDVCMVAGDDSYCSQFSLSPEPITVRIFSEQIGLLAVEQLLMRIRNPDFRPITLSVKPRLEIPG